jgi:hypothetical protein
VPATHTSGIHRRFGCSTFVERRGKEALQSFGARVFRPDAHGRVAGTPGSPAARTAWCTNFVKTVAKLYSSIASAGLFGKEKRQRIVEMPTPSGSLQEGTACPVTKLHDTRWEKSYLEGWRQTLGLKESNWTMPGFRKHDDGKTQPMLAQVLAVIVHVVKEASFETVWGLDHHVYPWGPLGSGRKVGTFLCRHAFCLWKT